MLHLRALGYVSESAMNGRDAVEKVLTNQYDAVLMDWHMPEMDGVEATGEIRRREGSSRHTRIIAMTASATSDDRDSCLRAGMDDYLTKPIRPQELKKILEEHSS